jgi:hypothetical protein
LVALLPKAEGVADLSCRTYGDLYGHPVTLVHLKATAATGATRQVAFGSLNVSLFDFVHLGASDFTD